MCRVVWRNMRRVTKVLLAVLCVSVSLVIGGPVTTAAAAPVPVTQTIFGAGSGTTLTAVQFLSARGSYTSTGQLGVGHYQIGFANNSETGVTLTRSDGMTLTGESGVIHVGSGCGGSGNDLSVGCIHLNLVGTADIASADLMISMTNVDNTSESPGPSSLLMTGTLTLRHRLGGYAMVDANGKSYSFGGVDHLGDAHTTAATDLELTPSHSGYWIANAAGQVFAFGDARWFGNANLSTFSPAELVTSLSATPTGKGYWLFTSKGRAIPFGDAQFHGDLHTTNLNGRIIGSIATPTGNGYYMVGTDGGVFAFGDAKFRGSTGNMRLNRPVVGLVPTVDNHGYWLVAADGGVFSFNAQFHGSMGGVTLNQPIVTMVPYDGAYLMAASDGGIFNFSKGLFFGSEGGTHLPAPIVGASAAG
jgi:hypothetical protein